VPYGGIRRCLVLQPMLNVPPAVRGGFVVEPAQLVQHKVRSGFILELLHPSMGLVVIEGVRQGMAKHHMPQLVHQRLLWMHRERVDSNLHAL